MPELSSLNLDGTNRDLKDSKAYRTDDTAETTLADNDYFPFYDTSVAKKKKTLWSNIQNVIKNWIINSFSSITINKGNSGTTITTTDGTVNLCLLSIRTLFGTIVINVDYFDLRMSNCTGGATQPVITITDSRLAALEAFNKTFAGGASGGNNYSNCFPLEGGVIMHDAYSNKLTIKFYTYFVTLKQGYLSAKI